MEALKILFLFLGIWWGSVNILKAVYREDIPKYNFLLMSAGWTGFIYLQWLSRGLK